MAESLQDSLHAEIAPDAPTQARRPEGFLSRTRPALRLILADDHALLRSSLVRLLENRQDLVVVAEASDGESALRQTLALLPDVLLLDLNMPGKSGLDILPTVRAKAPNVKVLVLTGREEDYYIVRALRGGAHGYILKSTDENELIDAIEKVTQGNLVLGRGVAEKIVTGLLHDPTKNNQLSEIERRVMLYVAAGFENDEIGRRLKLEMKQVIEAVAGAMNKLGAKDRNAAALQALREGYILLDDLQDLSN